MTQRNRLRRGALATGAALLLGLGGGAAVGCNGEDEEEAVEEGAEEAGQAAEEAGQEAEQAVKEADKEVGEDE